MEIADGKFGAFDVYREEDFATAGEVLDVAISTMFGAAWVLLVVRAEGGEGEGFSAWDGSGAFFADLSFDVFGCTTSVHVLGVWWLGYDSVQFVGCDELSFTLVPCCQDL